MLMVGGGYMMYRRYGKKNIKNYKKNTKISSVIN